MVILAQILVNFLLIWKINVFMEKHIEICQKGRKIKLCLCKLWWGNNLYLMIIFLESSTVGYCVAFIIGSFLVQTSLYTWWPLCVESSINDKLHQVITSGASLSVAQIWPWGSQMNETTRVTLLKTSLMSLLLILDECQI